MKLRNRQLNKESKMNIQLKNLVLIQKNLSDKEIKKLKKDGKVIKCPERRARGSKNARWGQCE